MLNLVIFGPPGSGKGTQSVRLAKKYNLVHLSTGDMLRGEIEKKTALGLAAKEIMDRGELVSDRIVIGMIEKQIENNPQAHGFIFDGFPRTTVQAMALDELLEKHHASINIMLSLEVNKEELVKRLLLRGKDSGRADDRNEEVIANRIHEYQVKTSPLVEYYRQEGKYRAVWGMGEIDEVFGLLCHEVDHAEAGDAHGQGLLQEAEIYTGHHNKTNKNKKHHKNQNLMLHEEDNDQHNHGHENHGHHDDDHGHEHDHDDDEMHDGHDGDHDHDDDHNEDHGHGDHDEDHDHADMHHEEEEEHEEPVHRPARKAAVKKAAPKKKAPAKKAPAKKAVKKAAKKAAKKTAKKAVKKAAPRKAAKKKTAARKKTARRPVAKKKAAKKKPASRRSVKPAARKAAPKKKGGKAGKGKRRR